MFEFVIVAATNIKVLMSLLLGFHCNFMQHQKNLIAIISNINYQLLCLSSTVIIIKR